MTLLRLIPQQTLGATPVRYTVPGYLPQNVEIVVVQSGSTAVSLDVYDETGNDQPLSSTANSPVHIKNIRCGWLDITGNGTTIVGGIFVANTDVDPSQFAITAPITVTGTIDTNIKQVAGVTTPANAGALALGTGGAAIDPRQVNVANVGGISTPAGGGGIPIAGGKTIVETEAAVNTNDANLSTTIITGSTTIPVGAIVTYNLGATNFGAAGNKLVEVQLVGHTSSLYYVSCFGGSTIASSFDMPQAEKLDAIVTNLPAVANNSSASYQAVTP